jgi:hypothetical protein
MNDEVELLKNYFYSFKGFFSSFIVQIHHSARFIPLANGPPEARGPVDPALDNLPGTLFYRNYRY